jgi:hypothetical protein
MVRSTFWYTLITVFVIVCLSLVYYYSKYLQDLNGYTILTWWNYYLDDIRNAQNALDAASPQIPSLQLASRSMHSGARRLETLIQINHDTILAEVKSLLATGYRGVKMSEIDPVQASTFHKQPGWITLWVKFIDCWAGTASSLPTLRRIVDIMGEDISLLHVSIFLPGTSLPRHMGISKGVLRYHYGLEIPDGQTGMTINDQPFRWTQGEGVVFDDTLPHTSFNHTKNPRMVIFADLPRDLNPIMNRINWAMMRLAQRTRHVQKIVDRLSAEGKSFN